VNREPRRWIAAATLGLAAVVGLVACSNGQTDDQTDDQRTARQAEVAERGAEVMPFDLDATTHSFEPTGTGLVQTVVADDPTHTTQIDLIRDHLTSEVDRFQQGDYGDPAAIHGDDMPGLAELEAHAGSVTIEFEPLADGARLLFTTNDPDLVDALHRWGQAQTTDHGDHADHPGS
jgi:hypothetical protein